MFVETLPVHPRPPREAFDEVATNLGSYRHTKGPKLGYEMYYYHPELAREATDEHK